MKKQNVYILGLLFSLTAVQAQQNPVSGGGNASGTGGTLAYSVGQLAYTANTGTNGSMAQGVQQPFEIQQLLGTAQHQISLSFAAYPNPTVASLTLEIRDFDYSSTTFQLFDLNGKLLASGSIMADTTTLNMQHLPSALYILNVQDRGKTIQSYKILKNQ